MLFSQDIGIDLGTSNTKVYVKGKGIVMRQPSVVAVNLAQKPSKVIAVGKDAKEMIGRTPGSVKAMHPLRDGVIADFDTAAEMLEMFIRNAMGSKIFAKARLLLCIPSGISEVERRNMHDVAIEAGARYVSLVEAPMAAAIGAGMPVSDPVGSFVVDIGGGTAEVAVISLGDSVASMSTRTAGNAIDEAVVAYIRKKYNLLISDKTGEEIKIKIGSAFEYPGEGGMEVKGRNLLNGLPKTLNVSAAEIREAISEPVAQIVNLIKLCLEKTPPELSSDIMDRGIMLTGGGSMLRSLDKLISKETGIAVNIAANPIDCVADGIGKFLEDDRLFDIGKKF